MKDKNVSDKIPWSGLIIAVQPRIRLWRSFDQFQHTYLGYLVNIEGVSGEKPGDFQVAVGKGAHEKHRFQTGMEVSGLSLPVADERMETSVPGIYAEVSRAEKVHVRAHNPDGSSFEEELEGMHAVCLQHEIDHLDGKLFIDYLSPLKRLIVTKKVEKQRKVADQKMPRTIL